MKVRVKGRGGPYLSSSFSVVLVRGAQRVPTTACRHVLHRVLHEPPAEPGSILDVVRAAPPVPALRWSREPPAGAALEPGIAAALSHVALTAGASDGMDESCRHDGVDKGRFFGSFKIK